MTSNRWAGCSIFSFYGFPAIFGDSLLAAILVPWILAFLWGLKCPNIYYYTLKNYCIVI